MPERPARLVLLAGTGTEVGKTWVGAELARHLRSGGTAVAARKPAQSFEPGSGSTDAEALAAATGESPTDVCPAHRAYEVAMAPFMAAEVLGRAPFTIADLVGEIRWPAVDGGPVVGIVESAGGVRSPIAADGGDTVALADLLRPDLVVLVADAGLGTINAVRLAVDALTGHEVVVFLNRFRADDDLHRRNLAWLAGNLGRPVVHDVEGLAGQVLDR